MNEDEKFLSLVSFLKLNSEQYINVDTYLQKHLGENDILIAKKMANILTSNELAKSSNNLEHSIIATQKIFLASDKKLKKLFHNHSSNILSVKTPAQKTRKKIIINIISGILIALISYLLTKYVF